MYMLLRNKAICVVYNPSAWVNGKRDLRRLHRHTAVHGSDRIHTPPSVRPPKRPPTCAGHSWAVFLANCSATSVFKVVRVKKMLARLSAIFTVPQTISTGLSSRWASGKIMMDVPKSFARSWTRYLGPGRFLAACSSRSFLTLSFSQWVPSHSSGTQS